MVRPYRLSDPFYQYRLVHHHVCFGRNVQTTGFRTHYIAYCSHGPSEKCNIRYRGLNRSTFVEYRSTPLRDVTVDPFESGSLSHPVPTATNPSFLSQRGVGTERGVKQPSYRTFEEVLFRQNQLHNKGIFSSDTAFTQFPSL